MADLVLIVAGPAVALALVLGYQLGRRSNVQRQVDARLQRELARPVAFGIDVSRDSVLVSMFESVPAPVHRCGRPAGCDMPAWECQLLHGERGRP